MNVLIKLWFLKQWATFRNLFKKPGSAIMTVGMILLYGCLITLLLTSPTQGYQMIDVHTAILMSIGFSAIMALSLLLQKRKALFYENDSFYLFCGPFTRKQVMRCLISQSILQSFVFSLLCSFMLICFGAGLPFTFLFLLLAILCSFLVFLFFMNITDYLYVLGISDPKYKILTKLTAGIFIVVTLVILGISLKENDFDIQHGLLNFAQSPLFYYIPVFGWQKMVLICFMDGQLLWWVLGLVLLVICNVVVYFLFVSFKGDFYEQAMLDAAEVSAYINEVRSGKKNAARLNAKVKAASVSYRNGAGAIFSKNMLIMKKTRDFITKQDIFILIFYFVISMMTELGFGMFCYMLIIWLFQVLQTSDLVAELKNYQIYLIPAKPMSKLWYALLPTLLKIGLLISAAVCIGGLFYQMPILDILQYWFMLIGYASIFISGTVLSIRILKSRTNMMLENMVRMVLILICALPGIFLTLVLVFSGDFDPGKLFLASNLSLVLNLILSTCILFACKNMMKGRELNSD